MSRKELLIWVALCLVGCSIIIGVFALIGHLQDAKKTEEKEKQATAQAVVTSEAMTYYSKNAAANLEKALKELDEMKPIKPGETK